VVLSPLCLAALAAVEQEQSQEVLGQAEHQDKAIVEETAHQHLLLVVAVEVVQAQLAGFK
jgi:hypothetical protein